MTDFEKVREIKKAARGRLLAIPGVHAVAVGPKTVGGKPTDEISIRVYVVKKKPPSELRAEEMIPAEINGVKTDVIESDVPRILLDASRYRPLVGGIMVIPGGHAPDIVTTNPPAVVLGEGLGGTGTLGCFASTGGPKPKIFAITNHHIVATPPFGKQFTLKPKLTAVTPTTDVTFTGTNTARTLVYCSIQKGALSTSVFYETAANDTLDSIASTVAKLVSNAPQGMNVTAVGPTLSFLNVNSVDVHAYSPHPDNTWAEPQVYVQGNTIMVSKRASRACAAYVSMYFESEASASAFVSIPAGAKAAAIADLIVKSVAKASNDAKPATPLRGVSAARSGAKVTITGAQEIDCDVSNHLRVGQPTNTMTKYPPANDEIGTIFDSHLDVDIALIQLDKGTRYRPDILEIGANNVVDSIKGIRDIHNPLAPAGYPLRKRGCGTGRTDGQLVDFARDGTAVLTDSRNNPAKWEVLTRFYTGAFTIGGQSFSEGGDSGAAVVNDNIEVVGILFAGSSNLTLATPIQSILDSFSTLNLTIETAGQPGVDKVVP